MSTKLIQVRILVRCAAMALLAAAAASCGDVVRSSRSPVMLVVSALQASKTNTTTLSGTLLSDVATDVTPCTTPPCTTIVQDNGSVSLTAVMKDATVAPTSNNQVTITGYHVEYLRADGRNTPGIDVPFPFDGAATATVIPGGTATAIGFIIVRHAAKAESPLIQLRYNLALIDTIAKVTFYGHDVAGNDLSVTGDILITFADFGG